MNKDLIQSNYILKTQKSQKKADFFVTQICLVFTYDYTILKIYILTYYFEMKKITLFFALISVFFISWCNTSHNFMDVDNPNAKEDLKNLIWSWNIPKIDTKNIVSDSLSWKRNDAKWYANKYYDDTLHEYVDIAKEWFSWAKQSLKWYYNSWIDELNEAISKKVNWAISWELNKYKIK